MEICRWEMYAGGNETGLYGYGELLTHAEYQMKPDHSYIRVTVYDRDGKVANTTAYFVNEMDIDWRVEV